MHELFPTLPEDIASLSLEELAALEQTYRNTALAVRDNTAELGELSAEQVIEQMQAAATAMQAIRAELAARAEAEENFTTAVAEAADEIVGETEEPETPEEPGETPEVPEGEQPEGEQPADPEAEQPQAGDPEPEQPAEGEPEPIAAAVEQPLPQRRLALPAVPRRHQPRPADGSNRPVLVAAAGLERVIAGRELDRLGYAETAIEVARRRGAPTKSQHGNEERILVASAAMPFPEDRTLRAGDFDGNRDKIAQIGNPYLGRDSRDTLVAAGGICAPLEPIYDIPNLAVTDRPVRDALPSFAADRGGVTVPTPSTIGDIDTAITVIEESDDALGGTFATKSCQAVDCPAFTDVAVGIIAHCREFGNLGARTWPEQVAHENDLTLAAHARTAEGRLLDRIDALSLAVTSGAVYGAVSSVLWALQLSRASIISRLRMDPATRFRVILPFWAAPMLAQDLVNSQFVRFEVTPEQVGPLLARFGMDVVWHLDQGIAGGADAEVFSDEAGGGALDDWLGTIVVARVFPEGTFLHIDGGTLELGLVRDSTLNSTNDYQLFGETFENVARIGPEQAAHRIEITACPSGTTGPTATAITCS